MLEKKISLTPRETNVIRLLCAGNRNEEICKKLHIKYKSLVEYLVNIRKNWEYLRQM